MTDFTMTKNGKQDRFERLDEATMEDLALMIDPAFLMQGIRAQHVGEPKYDGFNSKTGTFRFRVGSGNPKTPKKSYVVQIRFPELNDYIDIAMKDPEIVSTDRLLDIIFDTADVQVDCKCPSFVYWGYAYILTVLDAAIRKELRFPEVRNPTERGIFCKHCNRVFAEFDKHVPAMVEHVELYIRGKFGPRKKRDAES